MKHIREQDYVIALAIDGKMLDSVELSEKIGLLGVEGKSSVAFVIGGSLGLGNEVLKRADYKLSFSRMTFPHQLMQMLYPVSFHPEPGKMSVCSNGSDASHTRQFHHSDIFL